MSHIDSDQATGEYKENFMSQILQILQSYALFCIKAIQGHKTSECYQSHDWW